jgi:hypothetical protein
MTLTVDGGGIDPNAAAAARRAAEEANRRAAEEAARRAAEQAARAAAATAVRVAAESAERKAAQDSQANTGRLREAGSADIGAPPWSADDHNNRPEAAKRLEQGVTLDDLKKDPALAKSVADLKNSPDPVVRAEVEAAAKGWAAQIIDTHLQAGAGQEPKAVFDGVKQDIQQAGQDTGLGKMLADAAPAALEQRAIDTLNRKPSLDELQKNPAIGQMLATLQESQNPQLKQQLHDYVKGITQQTIDHNLQGKERESGLKQAVDDTSKTMVDLGAKTGLGPTIKDSVKDAFHDSKKKFEDTANKGKHWYEDLWDGVKNLVSSGADLVGHGLDAMGSVANHALGALGDLAHEEANLAASVMDAAGAHTLADGTREAGGLIDSGAHTSGAVMDSVLHTAGSVAEGGPIGLANAALDKVMGPEKPEYKNQMDGLTGAIANHLGKGDSVYIQGQGGAEVGVVGFVGGTLSGGATLSRGSDGKLTLSLSVGASVEAGVSAKTGGSAEGEAGGIKGGAGLKASASLSVSAGAQGKLNLTFDPTNPADVIRLKALMEPTPERLAVAAVTANPLAMAAFSGPALADAVKHNFNSSEGAETKGASATAQASAELGPLGAKADLGIDGVEGVSKKFYADGSVDTKQWVAADIHGGVSVNAGPVSAGASATLATMKTLTVTRDKDGNITGVKGENDGGLQTAATAGVGQTHELGGAEGAGITKAKSSVAGGASDTTKHENVLTAEGLRKFNTLVQAGSSPLNAYAEVVGQEGASTSQTSHTHTNEFSLGGKADVHVLGVGVTLSAKGTVGMSHTDESTNGASTIPDDNFNRNTAAHLVN